MPTSEKQRRRSLAKANKVRFTKKVAKEKLHRGEIVLMAALSRPPEVVLDLRVDELLLAAPGIGRRKMQRILVRANVSGSVKVRNCNPKARHRVLQQVAEMCPKIYGRFNA
jgi:hypothetical protein